MRFRILILISVFCCLTSPVHASGVYIEGGQGFYKSTSSQAMFLSYQIDSPPVFTLNSFYRVALGFWNEQNRDEAIIAAKGILWKFKGNSYLCFEPGAAYIPDTTQNLGTHLEFAFRFALGITTKNIDLSIGYRHFSNGKGIFRWTDTPNYGENFFTLQVGYILY